MILPYSSGGGGGGGYPGVTTDANGLVIATGLTTGGGNGSPIDPTYIQLGGNMSVSSAQGDYLDGDTTMSVVETADVQAGQALPPTAIIDRSVSRNGHTVTTPVLQVIAGLDPTGNVPLDEIILMIEGDQSGAPGGANATINVAAGMGLGGRAAPTDGGLATPGAIECDSVQCANVEAAGGIVADAGIGVWTHPAPVAQPSITGALSAVIDANAKAVLTSIIAVLVGAGFATDGTT